MTDDVCIIGGLGHVGLPLGIALARTGCRVVLYDVDRDRMARVAAGQMPFLEDGGEAALGEVIGRTLFLSDDRRAISGARFVVITVGTPVDRHLSPMFGQFLHFLDEIAPLLRDDQHVILRSTVLPGTTGKVRDHLAARGKRPRITFCPERIAQGKALHELHALPQIVGGFDDASTREAAGLFRRLTPDIVPLSPLEAELGKLFTNVWRYIQFAISNQFLQIAEERGVDYHRVLAAITHRYPRAASFAGPGFAAGPCLFKDTMQLAAYSDNSFFLGHAAMLINEGLPNHVVRRLRARLPLERMTVGILGMAFKADNDDTRDSLSYKLRRLLESEAARVLCSDPYVRDPSFVGVEELMGASDVVVLGVPHRAYASLVPRPGQVVVDVWNYLQPVETPA